MGLRRLMAGLIAVVLASSLGGQQAQAQQASQTFNLPAGGRAVISFDAYCFDFGGGFPQAVPPPNGLAPSNIRAAMAYIQTSNLSGDATKALNAQYAIWRLAGAAGIPQGDATTAAVIAAAKTTPADPANATSIINAKNAGTIDMDTISWTPLGNAVQIAPGVFDHFHGRGTLVVRNRTQGQLTLFMPVGTAFPKAYNGAQRVAGFFTGVTIATGTLPNTASFSIQPFLALLAVLLVLPIHFWRKRREQLIGRRVV